METYKPHDNSSFFGEFKSYYVVWKLFVDNLEGEANTEV